MLLFSTILLNHSRQNPNFVSVSMAMLSECFAPSLRSPLHRLAATLAPQFPCIVLFKLSRLSTSTVSNDRPTGYPEAENTYPMSDFLLNECGLRQSELSTILKRMPSLVRRRSSQTSQQALRLLRDSGFREDQVRKIITRTPNILGLAAKRQLKPKLELMQTLGLTSQESRNVISSCPRLLGSNLEKTLRPNIQYLQNLFGSEVDVSRAVKWAPQILIISNGPEILEKRLKHLASFGLLEDEIKELFRRYPLILALSMDRVQKMMDFFIHTAGLPAKFLLQYPQLLTFSLERRIKARHKVWKSISAMKPLKHLPSFVSGVVLTEQRFLEKYVKCSPHATKLLEIYSGKAVDLDIIQ